MPALGEPMQPVVTNGNTWTQYDSNRRAVRSATPSASVVSRPYTVGALRDPRLPSLTPSASVQLHKKSCPY